MLHDKNMLFGIQTFFLKSKRFSALCLLMKRMDLYSTSTQFMYKHLKLGTTYLIVSMMQRLRHASIIRNLFTYNLPTKVWEYPKEVFPLQRDSQRPHFLCLCSLN